MGRPRRKSSLSIDGKSSWISEYVWINSNAQATGSNDAGHGPIASAVAIVRMGRTRFPPANRLYRIASCRVAGGVRGSERCASKKRSTTSRLSSRYCLISMDMQCLSPICHSRSFSVIPAKAGIQGLSFSFCHPCEREDPEPFSSQSGGKSKNPGSPIGVGDDREVVVVAASPPSVILAFPFCHPCEREDPEPFSSQSGGKSKNPGSPIGVGDDREVVVVAASPPSVILAFPFCHPCEREDPESFLFA